MKAPSLFSVGGEGLVLPVVRLRFVYLLLPRCLHHSLKPATEMSPDLIGEGHDKECSTKRGA